MRILIVRHGEPDYAHHTLTEKGHQEARALAGYLAEKQITAFYVSPYGRALATAAPVLQSCRKDAEVLFWLHEFDQPMPRSYRGRQMDIPWDWLPQDWTRHPEFFDRNAWYDYPEYVRTGVKERYFLVCRKLDDLLAGYGYVRKGLLYHTEQGNHDTICLLCHFGIEIVMLSHLLNFSPVPFWHQLEAQPSSVTEVVTEERVKGTVSFRVLEFGGVEHLHEQGLAPSFSGRFAECYEDPQRH